MVKKEVKKVQDQIEEFRKMGDKAELKEEKNKMQEEYDKNVNTIEKEKVVIENLKDTFKKFEGDLNYFDKDSEDYKKINARLENIKNNIEKSKNEIEIKTKENEEKKPKIAELNKKIESKDAKRELRDEKSKYFTQTKMKLERSRKQLEIDMQRTLFKMRDFEYEYEEKDGVRIPLNGDEFRKINEKYDKQIEKMKDIDEAISLCDEQNELVNKELEEEVKGINKVISRQDEKEKLEEARLKNQKKEESEAEKDESEVEQEESENDIKIDDLEDKINKESNKIINDTEKNIEDDGRNERKEAKKRKIKITLGRSGKIIYGNQEYKVSKKDIKYGINFDLSDIQKMCLQSDLLVNSKEEIFGKLGEMFKNDKVDGLVVHAIMCAEDMEKDIKLELLEKYANDLKNLDENNIKNNTCNVTYDLDDLSRTNIISRLFRREVNFNEKTLINDKAVEAAENGIGKVEGEFKPSWFSRVVSSIKNRRLGSKEKVELLDEPKVKQEDEKLKQDDDLKDRLKIDKEVEEGLKDVLEKINMGKDEKKSKDSEELEIDD